MRKNLVKVDFNKRSESFAFVISELKYFGDGGDFKSSAARVFGTYFSYNASYIKGGL